jgi:hypothetical protein
VFEPDARCPLRSAALICAAGLPAQSSKPIALKGLMNSLKTHGLNAEFTKIVKTRGVDFELTPNMESDLKVAELLVSSLKKALQGTPGCTSFQSLFGSPISAE